MENLVFPLATTSVPRDWSGQKYTQRNMEVGQGNDDFSVHPSPAWLSAAALLTPGTRGSRVNNLRRVGAD